MSLESELNKFRRKRLQEEKERSNVFPGMMYSSRDIQAGPVNKTTDIAPVTSTVKKEDEDTWLQAGAFEDGYQFGDIMRTFIGTVGDATLGVVKGAAKMVGGVVDLGLYGASEIAGLFDEDAEKTIKGWAQHDTIDYLTEDLDATFDKDSILGNKTEGIEEGIGQIGAIILTGGAAAGAGVSATAATTALTFTSSMGNSMGEAYQEGATDGEAWAYGALSGAIDAGSEMIFGGLGKGVNALGFSRGVSSADDMLATALGNKFKSETAKRLVQFGVKAGAEGAEEVIAGVGSAFAKKLTYMSDEDIGQLLEDENLWEQFVTGTITAGVAQSGVVPGMTKGSVIESAQTGRDFITGYTANEQKVIDKVVEDRIKEAKQNGETVTKKTESKIREEVEEQLKNGEISIDTIEEVLGSDLDSYKAYKEAIDKDNATIKELEELYGENAVEAEFNARVAEAEQNGQKLTSAQKKALRAEIAAEKQKQLESEAQGILENSKRGELRTALNADVRNMLIRETKDKNGNTVKVQSDGYLYESYKETARRGQKFEADVNQYKDENARKTIQNIIDAGVANNTRRMHQLADTLAKISKDKGVIFNATDAKRLAETSFGVKGKTVNGFVTKDGITINMDSPKYLNSVVGHEISHVLEKNTDLYKMLMDAAFEYAKGKKSSNGKFENEYAERLSNARQLYKDVDGYKGTEGHEAIKKEVVADLVGDYLFTDSKFIENLSVKNRNLFQKIFDEIKYLWKIATAGSKEKRQLEKLKRAFEDAYRSSTTNAKTDTKTDAKAEGEKKYSLSPEQQKADTDYLDAVKRGDTETAQKMVDEAAKKAGYAYKGMHGTNADFNKFDYSYISDDNKLGLGFYFTNNEKLQFKYDYEKTAYLKFENPIFDNNPILDDILRRESDLRESGLSQEETLKKIQSEFGYDGIIAEYNRRALVAFNPEQMKSADPVTYDDNGNVIPLSQRFNAKNDDIRYSLSDSDGKKLTKAQSDYFKDSKMRDENGALKVMYHGSRNAGFHVFDPAHSDDGTSLFFVDRNDVAASYSGTSETYEAQSIRTAEDMNNFLAKIGYDYYEAVEKDGKFELLENGEHVAWSDTAKGIYEEFCWYEGVGDGDVNYKVYLNLTNPLEVDAEGRNWNNISREFSQELYDRYQTLTAEEKDALHDLTEWEDFRTFNDEVKDAHVRSKMHKASDEYTKTLASAYRKLGGGSIDMLDLFSIASDDFSEESLKEFAVKQMNTRDYAAKAKAEGYDGVIFKNIHDNGGYSNGSEGASTVAIAFDSNQVKSVANENPTADPDIRYSLSPETDKTYLDAVERGDMETAQKMVYQAAKDAGYTDDMSWKMQHTAPNSKGDVSLYGLKKSGLVPDDYWTHPQWYQTSAEEKESFWKVKDAIERQERYEANGIHHRDATMWVYRAVDKTVNAKEDFFRNGDWVTPSHDYAVNEGRMNPNGYRIIKQRVSIKDLYWDGNSIAELGYDDGKNYAYADTTNNRKLLDPVTYDDGGNVIPLSKRFKKRNWDTRYSLSAEGERQKRYGDFFVRSEDVKYIPMEDDIAPVQDAAVNAPETVDEAAMFPDDVSLQQLRDEMAALIPQLEAKVKANDREGGMPLYERYQALTEEIARREAQDAAWQTESNSTLSDADAPPEMDAPYYGESETLTADDPFANRDMKAVSRDRKTKAYMYENPEVKPFFQQEAAALLGELERTEKPQTFYNGWMKYEMSYEAAQDIPEIYRTKRVTTPDIAYLRDTVKMSYADIEKGLKAIIEDNGAENIAAAKKIEFVLNDRLLNGYEEDGYPVPPNQDYINLINEKQISEYSDEARKQFFEVADEYAPAEDIAPVVETTKPRTAEATDDIAPTYETTRKDQLDGQRTMFPEGRVAEVLTEEPETPERSGRVIHNARTYLLDKHSAIEDLALKTKNRELIGKANFMLMSERRAQTFIGEGKGGVRALNDLRTEVENAGLETDFSNYMYHKHNVDRMSLESKAQATISNLQGKFGHLETKQIYEIANKEINDNTTERTAQTIREAKEYLNALEAKNKPVFGDSVTAEVSQQKVAEFEKAHPEFKRWAKDVYGINEHLRKMLVDAGVISQETADLWATMYPNYVPIRRADKNGAAINVPLDTNRTGVDAPIKRATGGNSDILPLFNTLATRVEQTFRAVAKNNFGIELKNTLGTIIESKKTSIEDVIDSFDNHDELLQKGENGASPTFTVFEDGKRVTFEITEELYDALAPTPEWMKSQSRTLGFLTNLQRNLLTEYNPVFWATNFLKDFQDVWFNSQHSLKTYANMPLSFVELLTKGKWYQEYMENGGSDLTYFDGKKKTFTKEDTGLKWLIGIPFRAISTVNNFIERLPRLAEYIASRKNGASVEVAMLDAARVTTNFAAGGDFTRFLNRNGFTFLNASVQGFNQQVRNIREAKANGLKGIMTLAAKFAIAGLPAVLLNHLIWGDDDEYEELSDYVKDNYYIVAKNDDGTFVRIPKGRAMAVVQSAFDQMSNLVTGDDEVDLARFGQLIVENLAPNNPLDNNVFAPIVQTTFTNKTWYGDDLVPERLQNLPDAEQYDETTSSIAKWLGENIGGSPYKWNYVIDQYSGGAGDVFLPMTTPKAESGDNSLTGNLLAPWKDKFTTDSTLKNQNVSDFYDTMDELEKNANSMYATDEDALKYKYMNSVNADLSDLYKQKREIQNSNLSDKAKYDAVRAVQRQIDDLSKEALNTYNNVNIDGVYATVGDRHYRWYEPGEDSEAEAGWQKITDKQLEKQENVTSKLGISASEYWKNKEEYDYAYDYPEKYAVSKAVGGYKVFRQYASDLYDIKADKDEDGKSISGSRKEKVIEYINSLDADYYEKIILYKSEYNADDTYNYEIIEYLNNRNDISYAEMVAILKELGFTVHSDGRVTW